MYGKKYMNSECTSESFLTSISYTVDLTGILCILIRLDVLKVKNTCAYHENMEYAPVLLEIMVQRIKDYYRGNFLLQLWNKDTEKVYEKTLKYNIVSWNIYHDYLLFKTDKREEDKQYIYIVCFKDNFKEIKVLNFMPDPSYIYLGISQDVLHYGNSNTIKLVDIKVDFGDKKEVCIEPTPEQIGTYEIKAPCKLHGFFENGFSRYDTHIMTMIETSDNQIDFTRLYFWDRNITSPQMEFFQYREVVPRPSLGNDPVRKISQIILSSEFSYTLVLRNSGKVDIYWNFTLTATADDVFEDISSNYLSLFLKQKTPTGEQKIFQLDIKWDAKIGMDIASCHPFSDERWDFIKYIQIRDKVKIFKAMTLANTTFMVAYNNIISAFDIFKKIWIDHFIFDDEILELLRNQRADDKDSYFVGVYLKNGKIQPIESMEVDGKELWKVNVEITQEAGKGLKYIVSDSRDMSSHYMMIEDNGLKIVSYQGALVCDLTGSTAFKEGEYMVKFLSDSEKDDFAVYNRSDGGLRVYYNGSYAQSSANVYQSCSFNLKNFSDITERIHTIVQVAKDAIQKHLLVFTKSHLYIYDIAGESFQHLENMNITNVQFLDSTYIYCQCNDYPPNDQAAGLYFFDIEELKKKGKDAVNFRLKKSMNGANNLFDYYKQDERLAYLESYEKFKIVPLLHRNTINFIGMNRRSDYVSFRRNNDVLIALDKKNRLTSWSILSGKVKGQYQLKKPVVTQEYVTYANDGEDISYKSDWYMPKILLYNPEKEVEVDETQFFGDRMHLSLQNNTSYVSMEEKKFREFKVIEIISETEVIENFSFVHYQLSNNQYHRFYFSSDLTYMLERLINLRVFLYKREDLSTPGQVKWNLIRKIKQFPLDISECTYNNFLFSPDLMFYLDFDKSDNCFLIKKSLDQSIQCRIPKGLMNPSINDPKMIAKRFRWVTNQTIKVVNQEGIEKIIDIQNGFKDINQDTVPMFDVKDQEVTRYHYFFQPIPLSTGQTLKRLVKKFQKYNSNLTLDSITDREGLYDTLYEVDYSLDAYSGKLVVDMSFTYIHWKMAELFSQHTQKYKVKQFSLNELKMLALNIFPKGNTVLHYSYKNLSNIRKLYQMIELNNSQLDEKEIKFEIPFLQNFKRKSPLHLSTEDKNYKAADIFLQHLAKTPLDSHSRQVVDVLPSLVENQLPFFGSYLDARLLQTQQLINRGLQKGAIRCEEELDYAVGSCELWPDIQDVEKKLFAEIPKEQEIKLEFLDMPLLHSFQNEVGDQFFSALGESDDIELFSYRSIQALIDYKWKLAREYTVKILFIPFLCFHLNFSIFSNVFNGQYEYDGDKETGNMYIGFLIVSAFNYGFSIYFLFNEVRQLLVAKLDYFKSIWNYSDLLPPLLIIIITSMRLCTFYFEDFEPSNFIHTLHSIACLLMWAKLLYFLRIFKSTGYLVRTLTDVCYDMKIFLLILFIVYFGFGEAFLRISEKSDEGFIENYPMAWVRTFSGDLDTSIFDSAVQHIYLWIIWVVYNIIINIVMLNLLISIISDSFAGINEKAKQANYQERARIIAENSYLIPVHIKARLDDFDKYIIIATEVNTEDNDEKTITDQVKNIETQIQTTKDEITAKNNEIEWKLDSLLNN